MTAELRIRVPHDVAEWLCRNGDESTAVTEVVRARIRAERIEELLRRPVEPPTLFAEGRRTLAR